MSLFITFEGGEGTGKSLQTRALHRRLARLGIPVLLTYEPGGMPLGRKIARLLKWSQNTDISPLAELLLFNASRAHLVNEVIRPGLQDGKVVICDRYTDSTLAYQGYGRGLDLETVKTINDLAAGKLGPDLTILLDLSVEAGLARKTQKRSDRFEEETLDFHRKVRQGYLELARKDLKRWLVVDASLPKKEIAEIIWQRVKGLLSRQVDHG